MRHLITLCEAIGAKFVLHPSLDPKNYVITPSLGQVANWKAKVYEANSGGEIGQMDKVGYVMISLTDNTIIPIARGDEHHQGYDLLHRLARKGHFKPSDYQAVWPYGNNYIYDKRDIRPLLTVLTKYLAYGGNEGVVKGTNDLTGQIVTISHFVKMKGAMTVKPKQLGPLGQMVIDAYRKLAAATQAARTTFQKSQRSKAFLAAYELLQLFERFALPLRDIDWNRIEADMKAVKQLRANDDIDGLDQLFFGFHSIKNNLHNKLREAQKRIAAKKLDWYDKERQGVWGDLDQAVDMLGRF